MARSVCIGMLFLLLFGELIAPYDPLTTRPHIGAMPPSALFIFGTDTLGRDVLSRVLHGGRVTALLAVGAAMIGIGLGMALGTLRAFGVGLVGNITLLIELVLLSLPGWLMALVFVGGMGASWKAVIIGVGVTQIAPFSRIVAMTFAQTRTKMYVTAAEACGAPARYIVLRVIVPNASPILIGAACITLANGLLFASGLTFLGLGGEISSPEWGAMLAEGRLAIRYAPWIAIASGLPLVMMIASLNAMGRRFSLRGWSS